MSLEEQEKEILDTITELRTAFEEIETLQNELNEQVSDTDGLENLSSEDRSEKKKKVIVAAETIEKKCLDVIPASIKLDTLLDAFTEAVNAIEPGPDSGSIKAWGTEQRLYLEACDLAVAPENLKQTSEEVALKAALFCLKMK